MGPERLSSKLSPSRQAGFWRCSPAWAARALRNPQAPAQPAPARRGQLDLGGLLGKLLPAGLAYLQAKQSGADSSQAMQTALVSAVLGIQPSQAQTPRQGAGAALAQGMLKALFG